MRKYYIATVSVLAVALLAGAAAALTNPVTGLTATPQGGITTVSCRLNFSLPADPDVVGARVVVNGSNDPTGPGSPVPGGGADGVVVADVAGAPSAACTATYNVPIAQMGRVFWYRIWTYDATGAYCSVSAGITSRMLVSALEIKDTTPLGLGTAIEDSPLRGDWPNCNIGQNGGDRQWRMFADSCPVQRHNLLKLDVSLIPPGMEIASANLGIYIRRYNSVATVNGYQISRLNPGKSWVEGEDDFSDPDYPQGSPPTGEYPIRAGDVTWNEQGYFDGLTTATGNWATPGATGAADIDLATSVSWDQPGGGADPGYRSFDLTAFVLDWVNGVWENNGILFWGGTADPPTTGNTNYNWGYLSESTSMDRRPALKIFQEAHTPHLTAPIGNPELSTPTPTITWLSYADGTVINHQVRVCSTDDPSASVVYDSGAISGNATSAVSGALANGSYWAFANEETASGWVGWSATGNGGFRIAVVAPAQPVITSPTGIIADPKPMVLFPGAGAHTSLQMKIFTSNVGDPETATAYYDSTVLASAANSCPSGMLPNGDYWAFVKIANAAGWSPWSAGKAFTVSRADWVDVLHMNETVPDLLVADNPGGTAAWTGTVLTNPSNQDGFAHEILDGTENVWSVDFESGACGATSANKLLIVENPNPGGGSTGHSRSMRIHKCQDEIDLDRGVTYIWELAVENGTKGTIHGGKPWIIGTIYVADKDPSGVFRMVSVRCRPDSVGIVSNQTAAITPAVEPGGYTLQSLPFSEGFRRFRLTGRNQIAGDYNSAQWTLYVNDVETLTSTGTYVDNTYDVDFVSAGVGESNIHGKWSFDWIAVNGGGDYGPGEWDPIPASQSTFTSIGAAKIATVGNRSVTINGPAVITKVLTHVDPGPDAIPGTADDVTVQDGYYVQDIAAGGKTLAGVKVLTSDAQGGAVAVGAQVTAISGTMVEQTGGRVIANASVTLGGIATFAPVAMAQKALYGPCMTQNLGSSSDTTYMMVRVFGRCTLSGFDPNWGAGGAFVFHVDDGSGAVDGRDGGGTGIRSLHDATDPGFVPPGVGDYLMIEGIASYELAEIYAGEPPVLVESKNVRTILYPTYTTLYIPPPP